MIEGRKRCWPHVRFLVFLSVVIVKVVHAEILSFPTEQLDTTGLDHEFEALKEIFKKNLLQDYLENEHINGDEQEAGITQRVKSFVQDRHRYASSGNRTRRDVNDDDADAAIEADTAEARHLYLKGFRERGYVPVNFPIDICLLRVGNNIFAAALHQSETSNRTKNATTVSFYRRVKGKFEKYHEHNAVTARHFDCVSIAHLGFVAVANYHDEQLTLFDEGSPVFQIAEDGTTEIVQKFGQPNQNTVHLWVHGKHVYLTHTYVNLDEGRQNVCPLYRWSGYYFDVVDHMPCYNAAQIEAFSIEQQMFVAVAKQLTSASNSKDSFSDIFVLNPDTQKLALHQQIYIYSVSDIAYFFIEVRERREHFLVLGNSLDAGSDADNGAEGARTSQQSSIVYKFVDGYFVPFQNMDLAGVSMFLPVVHENGQFLLLVLCRDQPLLIYEYDGWKLVPSRIDYTGEAFAAGVAHMRVYRHIVNASVIVIANSNLFGKSVNLFTPQYGVENDLRQVYAHFIEWCERMHQQTAEVNLEELYNRLAELPDSASDGARTIDKTIELQDSTVGTAKAKSVKTKHLLIDDAQLSYVVEVNEYVQRVKAKMDLVEQTVHASVLTNDTVHWHGDLDVSELIAPSGQMKQLDVKVLNNGAHKTRQTDGGSTERQADGSITVDRLIVDRFVDVRFWNGHAAETLLLTDDAPSKWKDLSVTAKKVVVGGHLYVNKLIDGVLFHPSNVLLPGVDQVFGGRTLVVKDLSINRLTSKRLNATDAGAIHRMMDQSRTLLAKSRGARAQAYGSDFDTIDVNDLEVTGLLNEVGSRYLAENVLTDEEVQQELVGKLVVDQITADNVAITESKLSDVEFSNIARTTGEQEIRQDLQFVQPITVGSLVLRDRLNHIPVIDGKLQVLLLDSTETQSITGTKTFDYVTLLKPIELQGKIDGEALSKMNPIVTTAEDLVLDGNYTILGNVTFNGLLWAHNILSADGAHDLYRLATDGLRLDGAPGPNQVIKFLQPVFAEHLSAPRINQLDANDVVSQASGEVQYLTGRKTFIGDLAIDGMADANEINKVDLNQLNRTIFRRGSDGIGQIVEGTIHFDTVITSVVNAKGFLFEGKRIDKLLRLDIPQNVSVPVRFDNCTIYVANAVFTQELHTDNSSLVYGYDMEYLFKDTLRPEPDVATDVPIVVGPKSFRNLTLGQLVLLDGSTLNALPVQNIKHIIEARENRMIIKNETYNFLSDITVNHLHFEGSINGIPKESFCRAWLTRTGNQTFTVGQTFDKVSVEKLHVAGTLNGGVTMEQLLENVYRTDREEYIDQAIFHEGIVAYEPSTVGGLVSGLNLSTDVLLKQSPEIQTLGTVQVQQTLEAKGELHILNHLNGIHFPKMMEFFAPSKDKERAERAPANIEVRGNVYFDHDPTVIHLNGHNIQKLYGEVWLAHRPTVLTGRYHFDSAEFRNNLHTYGQPINHLDWSAVDELCLSGKRRQNISAPLEFAGDVTIYAGATFHTVGLDGRLKRTNTSEGIDVKEYDKYALRYHGNQEITGDWMFHSLEVAGEFNITTLNGFNVKSDLLRTDVPANNFTATKRFRALHVESIICPPPCVIQEVDMDEWFTNGLRLKGNQTIQGTLSIVNGIFTGNVEVLGTVNGIRYDADHLMLKSIPQSSNGTLRLITKFPKENKIFPLVFESLHSKTINGKDVAKFLHNVARKDTNPLTINIPVSFASPVEAEETLLEGDMLFGVNVTDLILSTSYQKRVNELASQVRSLNSVNEKLAENVFEHSPVFRYFDKMNPLPLNAVRMLVLTLPLHPSPVEVVAVHVAEPGRPPAVNFFHWSSKKSSFVPAKSFPPIEGRDRAIVNMKKVILGEKQHLFLQFFEQRNNYFVQHILDLLVEPMGVNKFVPLYVMNSTRPRDVVWMKLVQLDCIVMYSKGMIGFEVRCLREQNLMPVLEVRQLEETVAPIQIVALENHLVLLDNNERIQIWRTTANFYLKHHQTIAVSHPSYLSMARYENQLMLAINSEQTPNTAHHGSIEIWRKTLSKNGTFTQHQLILTKLPKQLQFSVLPSNELLLYTLTENWLHPLVIYRYEGVTGFREVMTTNTIRQKAKGLSVLKFRLTRKEIVAIVGPESTDFVNVVFV